MRFLFKLVVLGFVGFVGLGIVGAVVGGGKGSTASAPATQPRTQGRNAAAAPAPTPPKAEQPQYRLPENVGGSATVLAVLRSGTHDRTETQQIGDQQKVTFHYRNGVSLSVLQRPDDPSKWSAGSQGFDRNTGKFINEMEVYRRFAKR